MVILFSIILLLLVYSTTILRSIHDNHSNLVDNIEVINDEITSLQENLEIKTLQDEEEIKILREEIQNVSRSRQSSTIFTATAYTYTGYNTCTGIAPRPGIIAVDPKVIPLHSRVWLECDSYPEINGVYEAQDTGGAIRNNIVDIFLETHDECIKFGRRTVRVKIL